jgi:hypothetical protein
MITLRKGANMRKLALAILIVIIGFAFAGCEQIVEPKTVTLENAMKQVATGLNEMYKIGKDYPKTGLTPSEVTIEFNVSAKGTKEGKLVVGTAVPLEGINASGEIGSKVEASRGNKVTVKFVNLFLSDTKDSLIMIKQPDEIAKILKVLEEAGYTPVIKGADSRPSQEQ